MPWLPARGRVRLPWRVDGHGDFGGHVQAQTPGVQPEGHLHRTCPAGRASRRSRRTSSGGQPRATGRAQHLPVKGKRAADPPQPATGTRPRFRLGNCAEGIPRFAPFGLRRRRHSGNRRVAPTTALPPSIRPKVPRLYAASSPAQLLVAGQRIAPRCPAASGSFIRSTTMSPADRSSPNSRVRWPPVTRSPQRAARRPPCGASLIMFSRHETITARHTDKTTDASPTSAMTSGTEAPTRPRRINGRDHLACSPVGPDLIKRAIELRQGLGAAGGLTAVERFIGTQRGLSRADRDLALDWADNNVRGVFEVRAIAGRDRARECVIALNLVDDLDYRVYGLSLAPAEGGGPGDGPSAAARLLRGNPAPARRGRLGLARRRRRDRLPEGRCAAGRAAGDRPGHARA